MRFSNNPSVMKLENLYLLCKFLEWNPVTWYCTSTEQVRMWICLFWFWRENQEYLTHSSGEKVESRNETLNWKVHLKRNFPISRSLMLDWDSSAEAWCFITVTPQNSAARSLVTGSPLLRFPWYGYPSHCGPQLGLLWSSTLVARIF